MSHGLSVIAATVAEQGFGRAQNAQNLSKGALARDASVTET